MQDDLVGFVLGALDEDEHLRIERKLVNDTRLQNQLQRVQTGLKPLSWAPADEPPPVGLADRTCAAVDQFRNDSRGAGSGANSLSAAPVEHGSEASQWSFADFVVAAGICVAASCLFFPAISTSRYNSQLAMCQNNMRQLGVALTDYSSQHGGYFPVVPARGNLAVAGVYAPKLTDKGYVTDSRLFVCPSKRRAIVVRIPKLRDLNAARGPQLIAMHRTMGGDYAYTLGYRVNGRLQGVRNRGRVHFALLADAPSRDPSLKNIGVHGSGQNVLFEDGHAAYLAKRIRPGSRQDDLFLNDDGFLEAGLHEEDSVLAASSTPPLPFVWTPVAAESR